MASGDRVAEQIGHRPTGRGLELEITALGIPHQHAAALERAADSLGQPLDERLQLGLARRRNAPERRRLGADEVRAVEHEHGTGLLYHIFDGYAPRAKGDIGQRINGALVSMVKGKALAYTLFNLQESGSLFIGQRRRGVRGDDPRADG
jgi:GTP-binding protein